MGSVIEFPAGRSFEFTVKKSWANAPAETWVNTTWAISIADGVLGDLITMGRAIADWERLLTRDTVNFIQWSVRTGSRENPPTAYDFYTEPIGALGRWTSAGTQPEDKRLVWWLDKRVFSGRMGRTFIRGALTEADVEAPAGTAALAAASVSAYQARLASANTDYLAPYFHGGSSTIMRLCVISWNGLNLRFVRDLNHRGVTVCKLNHKYFDRRDTTPGPSHPNTISVPPEMPTLEIPEWELLSDDPL